MIANVEIAKQQFASLVDLLFRTNPWTGKGSESTTPVCECVTNQLVAEQQPAQRDVRSAMLFHLLFICSPLSFILPYYKRNRAERTGEEVITIWKSKQLLVCSLLSGAKGFASVLYQYKERKRKGRPHFRVCCRVLTFILMYALFESKPVLSTHTLAHTEFYRRTDGQTGKGR